MGVGEGVGAVEVPTPLVLPGNRSFVSAACGGYVFKLLSHLSCFMCDGRRGVSAEGSRVYWNRALNRSTV